MKAEFMKREVLVRKFPRQGLVWLLAALLTTFAPNMSWARGGGGCLGEGTLVQTPNGPTKIENLREGDLVWGVTGKTLQAVRVEAATKLDVEGYIELLAGEARLLVTAEHPLMVGPGEFRAAGQVQPGDRLIAAGGNGLQEEQVRSVRRIPAEKPAYNLLVSPGGTFIPEGVVVHNKGCFLPDSLILRADGKEVPISTVRPGDTLLAFTAEGRIVRTTVRNVLRLEVDEHVILRTDREMLRVTADHPFYVGEGTFKTLEVLQVGDRIIAWDGQSLTEQQIVSLEPVPGRIAVYNLQTEAPHTFFVGHVAVHNKGGGGGGGCFPPGTPIATPQGQVPIESLLPGDVILGMTDQGLAVPAKVRALLTARNTLLKVETRQGWLEATPEHPMGELGGGFRPLGQLHRGDRILRREGGKLISDRLRRISQTAGETLVFNLQVDEPHTFLAAGFVVHNKGGSSSSSHSSSSSSSGSSSDDDGTEVLIGVIIVFVSVITFILVLVFLSRRMGSRKSENLDFVYSPSAVARKANRTAKLLQFLSRQDPSMAPETLRKLAEATFRKLEECWEKRDYGPMEPLMMPSLFALHTAQIQGMIRNHEINRIEELEGRNSRSGQRALHRKAQSAGVYRPRQRLRPRLLCA